MSAPSPTPPALDPLTHIIEDGIEGFRIDEHHWEAQCARCGSSVAWLACPECDDGYTGHDCGEDCCACLHPEPNVGCFYCDGKGGAWHCVSSPEFCKGNPMPGREHIESTAMRSEAWND